MTSTPIFIGPDEIASLTDLAKRGRENVLDINEIAKNTATVKGKRAHMKAMAKQSVLIPFGFLVTFSVENGHPAGTCLHMSMSSPKKGRAPTPEVVWMVCEYLGFRGGFGACRVWEEKLLRGEGFPEKQVAINVVQPIPT